MLRGRSRSSYGTRRARAPVTAAPIIKPRYHFLLCKAGSDPDHACTTMQRHRLNNNELEADEKRNIFLDDKRENMISRARHIIRLSFRSILA